MTLTNTDFGTKRVVKISFMLYYYRRRNLVWYCEYQSLIRLNLNSRSFVYICPETLSICAVLLPSVCKGHNWSKIGTFENKMRKVTVHLTLNLYEKSCVQRIRTSSVWEFDYCIIFANIKESLEESQQNNYIKIHNIPRTSLMFNIL